MRFWVIHLGEERQVKQCVFLRKANLIRLGSRDPKVDVTFIKFFMSCIELKVTNIEYHNQAVFSVLANQCHNEP